MSKLIIVCLVTLLCLPVIVLAASIGGAETQGKGKPALGIDTDYTINRDLKLDKFSWEDVKSGGAQLNYMYRAMVKASYGILDNIDIYTKLGTSALETEDKEYGAKNGVYYGKDIYECNNAFAYGFGIKGTYPLKNDWLIGIDLQYIGSKNTFKDKWYDAAGSEDTSKGKITVHEWQVAPYVAKKINNFVPYLGVKYSDLRLKERFPDDGSYEKYKADDTVGVFLGTDYKIGDHWKLNLEGRFVDETAVSAGMTYRF